MGSVPKHLDEQIRPTLADDRRFANSIVDRDKIRTLRELAIQMQRQLESLSLLTTPPVDQGLDFYDEVSRFEIELIKKALKSAQGHQTKAAQLLNLKATTLNVMIKRYRLQFEQLPEPISLEPNPERLKHSETGLNARDNLRRNRLRGGINKADF